MNQTTTGTTMVHDGKTVGPWHSERVPNIGDQILVLKTGGPGTVWRVERLRWSVSVMYNNSLVLLDFIDVAPVED